MGMRKDTDCSCEVCQDVGYFRVARPGYTPMPGLVIIERCGLCELFASDVQAAEYVAPYKWTCDFPDYEASLILVPEGNLNKATTTKETIYGQV